MIVYSRNIVLLVGRIFLAGVFIYDGFNLIHAGMNKGELTIVSAGLPQWTWYLALLLELGGGIMVFFGLLTRLVSAVFVVFCLMTAFFFHNAFSIGTAFDFSRADTVLEFGRDIGLAGGFLLLIADGAGALSLDAIFRGK